MGMDEPSVYHTVWVDFHYLTNGGFGSYTNSGCAVDGPGVECRGIHRQPPVSLNLTV